MEGFNIADMIQNNISVLMSVYHKDNPIHLWEALNSINRQTFKAKEIIIVFDGPLNKELYSVVDEFKEALNIITIQNKTNQGLAKSLNIGLSKVNYNLVARMDADDIAVNTRFEKQIKIFNDSSKEVDVLGGYVSEFTDNTENSNSIRKVPKNLKDVKRFAKYRSPLNHPTVMIKTTILKEVGGYPTTFNKLEDYALWINILNKNYIITNTTDVLLHMRTSDAMYERRGGIEQAKAFYALRRYMYRIGYINWFEMIIGIFTNISISIMDSKVRKALYKLVRRYK